VLAAITGVAFARRGLPPAGRPPEDTRHDAG
jgi:hypothetical protein